MNALAPVAVERKGDWILTISGGAYWPCDPSPDDVKLEDIAHGLAAENRYAGHTYRPFSVAQHSCIVADHLPWHLKIQGLLHDATEAYLKDIPRPIKKYLPDYKRLEEMNARAIGERFTVELVNLDPQVHEADRICLYTEKRDLRPVEPRTDHLAPPGVKPWPEFIVPWTFDRAKAEFLTRASMLGLV